jgi:hypothetical protein
MYFFPDSQLKVLNMTAKGQFMLKLKVQGVAEKPDGFQNEITQ